MKTLKKFFISILLACVLGTGVTQNARAQFGVIDPANLAQSILDFLEHQLSEGGIGTASLKLIESSEKIEQWRETVELLKNYAQAFNDANKVAKAIYHITCSIAEDKLIFENFQSAVQASGAPVNYIRETTNLIRTFDSACTSFMSFMQRDKQEYQDLLTLKSSTSKNANKFEITHQIAEMAQQFEYEYFVMRSYYVRQMVNIGLRMMNAHNSEADGAFVATMFY